MMEADNNHNFTLYSHIIFNIKENKININRKKYVTKRDHCLTVSKSLYHRQLYTSVDRKCVHQDFLHHASDEEEEEEEGQQRLKSLQHR